jgi:hypothetical protein
MLTSVFAFYCLAAGSGAGGRHQAAAEKGEASARALSETHAKALADLRAAHKGELDEARSALKALEAQVRPVPPRPIPSTSHAVTRLLI